MENIENVAKSVLLMDKQLREELLVKDGKVQNKKLWEHTHIKKQIDRRKNGDTFTVTDHIRAKFAQLGEALTAEYLRNVGYDIAKPDRHICRILGSDILGCSDKKVVPIYEAFDIVAAIANALEKDTAEVDYILWSYCASGYGEICTLKNPKCQYCVAKQICKFTE